MNKNSFFSRRALLAGTTGLAAVPLVSALVRERLPLLTQTRGVPGEFIASLVERLERHFTAAGRSVRIEPLTVAQQMDLAKHASGITGDALVFAGESWANAWLRALPASARPVRISLGAEFDSSYVASSTWQALELGGAWSARSLGQRAGILVAADQSANDLPFAFEHGVERAGGSVVRRVVAIPGRAQEAWAELAGESLDVVAVLASGSQAAQLWSHAPRGLATLTHQWSGGEGRSHVVRESGDALDTLAARVVARVQNLPSPSTTLSITTPTGVITSLGSPEMATLVGLSLRNRSAYPFTGC